MVNPPHSKAARKHFRKLAATAYERELGRALEQLHVQFERWKIGEVDAFDLDVKIHEYHNGIARDLFKRYEYGDPELAVGAAIVSGILLESEVDERYLPWVKSWIELFEEDR